MSKLVVFGNPDERTVEQVERCAVKAERAVLCADSHVGYSAPIGSAIAYENYISPSGVGYDIGCGNKAVLTPLEVSDVPVAEVMDEIVRRVSFGMGRNAGTKADHPVLDEIAQASLPGQRKLAQTAAQQLGTVGGGNHYVDLFADESDRLWIGVHFGSRGFGHKTASGFLALAQGKDFGDKVSEGSMDAEPTLLAVDSELGQAYIEAMTLAGEYAYAGRDIVTDTVLDILGTESQYEVHNHHNFAWRERHEIDGEERDLWVVRKGCTPAFPGQEGFVGGSMGDISVILRGADTDTNENALYSTVHGAGRQMSRTQAAGKVRRKKVWECSDRDCRNRFPAIKNQHPSKGMCPDHPNNKVIKRWVEERKSEGAIDWDAVQAQLVERGIVLRGGAADEAPGAYKRLPEVLSYHEDAIDILHTLTPVGVAMAGPGIPRDD